MSSTADARLERVRDSLHWLLRAIGQRFREGRCAQVAGSLAFTTLLSLVPFITLVAVVLSKFPQSASLEAALRRFLLENLLPETAGKVIAAYAGQFSQKATNLTIVGTIALVVTTIMLMRTIDTVINQIWMVRSRRPWATRLAAYWLAVSFGPLLLAGGVFVATAMLSVSLDVMNEPAWLAAVGVRIVSVVILGCIFSALYYAVPHCSVRVTDALLAGFVAALAFMLMQRIFGLYLSHFPSYTLVYGAFAAVPIFLLWLYLSWIVILLGAVIAAVLPERSVLQRALPQFPGRAVYVALRIATDLAEAQQDGGSRGVEELAGAARVSHGEAREVLEAFEEMRIAVRREQGGWLLARPSDGIAAAEIVRRFGWSPLPMSAAEQDQEQAARAGVDARWADIVAALDVAAGVSLRSLLSRPSQAS